VPTYEYAELILERGAAGHLALSKALAERARAAPAIGQFSPQLGFASNEAVVILRGTGLATILPAGAPIVSRELTLLTPTIRPRETETLAPGGIYVHRWFTIDGSAMDEFVSLSGRAWPDFERLFDARIFGLFSAQESEQDRRQTARRMLLLTRYGGHDVWERSRDPSTDAMQIFLERQRLTRTTVARSSLLVTS
jgi:hypothetical protein